MGTAAIICGSIAVVLWFIWLFTWDYDPFDIVAFVLAGVTSVLAICFFIGWAVGDQSRYDTFVRECNSGGGYVVGDGNISNCVKDGKLFDPATAVPSS